MRTFKYKSPWCDSVDIIRFRRDAYRANDALAVVIENIDPEEDNPNGWEPYGVATVNLMNSGLLPDDVAYVDTENNPGLDKWLVEHGLAEYTGEEGVSGSCSYPAMKFHLDELS